MTAYIEFRPNRRGEDRAFIRGSRVRVQDIVSDYEVHGMTADEIAREYPHINLAQIHAALSYYFDNAEIVRRHMRADKDYADSLTADSTSHTGTDADGNPDPVSS